MKNWWIFCVTALLTACDGGGGTTTAAGGTAGAGGTGAAGGTGGTAMPDGGASGTSMGSGGAGGTSMGSGGSGGTSTMMGDCSASQMCADAAESCVFPADSCAPTATGNCQKVDCSVLPNHGPVCLCDGQVFEGDAECLVWQQNRPIAKPEVCATGTFNCGKVQCQQNTEFCFQPFNSGPNFPPDYECKKVTDVKSTCLYGVPDCSCIDLIALGCTDPSCCQQDGFYQETISVYP